MIFLRYSETVIEANTYILADEEARSALVVDTGGGSADWIKATLADRGLTLGAVLLTHGHSDHVWDASAVVSGEPVYIPEPDLYRLDNLGESIVLPQVAAALRRSGIPEWRKPETAMALPSEAFSQGMDIVDGIHIRAIAAPGHSEGSSVFLLEGSVGADEEAATSLSADPVKIMISGDVLFRDGIGRTDLPGGDDAQMRESLRMLIQIIDPQTRVFPGHGAATTMGREISSSMYLRAYTR